ncbi:hypothetical protein [Streptomyces sp. NPDC059819]|uniref:hypothetical protein n=1 Tax=Streptomyces sp. NPDC059819 TaxID=3346963 RepID=UPI0036685075
MEYADGERGYYDTTADPNELQNKAPSLSVAQRDALHATLTAMRPCSGGTACEKASTLQPVAGG